MISLDPHHQANGRWGCRYSILLEGLNARGNSKGELVEADFMTSLAAEIAALKAAKGQIDVEIAPSTYMVQAKNTTG
ncbi:MAG: hypothetical protein NDI90_05810 [Nitrospira sp. BO4]|nr:hypothetical protein [Nitrospira sp. BO4]